MTDGHHRAMMAIEQGHLFVPVKRYDNPADYWAGSGYEGRKEQGEYRH